MRFRRAYTGCALLLFNGLVVFGILNLGVLLLMGGYRLATGRDLEDPVTSEYGAESLPQVYPGRSAGEIRELLHETWSRPLVYEPFTQFREREFTGQYVNVTAEGYRRSADQAPWPPDPAARNVFVFGGSTTFGYGLADGETVASRLQHHLGDALGRAVHVYNFGRGFYFSSQERPLLERLVLDGFVPDLAVFIDGLNEFYHPDGRPHYTRPLAECLDRDPETAGSAEVSWIRRLPISRLLRALRKSRKRAEAQVEVEPSARGFDASYDDPAVLQPILDRYRANLGAIRAFARSYGFPAVFVWQPVPTYRYDLGSHLFYGAGFETHSYSHFGYEDLREQLAGKPLGDDFLWCADLQEGRKEPLYVDKYHYTAGLSDELAAEIVRQMLERKLLDGLRP